MPDDNIGARVDEVEKKIDAIFESVEKTRKYILTTMIISVALIVVPMIGLLFAAPSFMGTFNEMNSALNDVY